MATNPIVFKLIFFFVINAATYVGFRAAGTLGACVATLAVSLPSLILIQIAVLFLEKFKTNKVVQAILAGIRPATVGLMASAFLFIAQTAIFPHWAEDCGMLQNLLGIDTVGIVVFIVTYVLIRKTKLGAIKITFAGGAMGVILSLILQHFVD